MMHIDSILIALPLAGILWLIDQAGRRRFQRKTAVAIIPARYDSSRFPGKPLALIAGKPMIQRTWEQACRATSLEAVYIATDSERIRDACVAFGANVIMTDATCPNGTARCAEAARKLPRKCDMVVNVQGDEPLLEPEAIDAVVQALRDAPAAVLSTACTPLAHKDVALPQRVKCVTDENGYALYFSRAALPSNKDGVIRDFPAPFADRPYLLHLGLTCLSSAFLQVYAALPATPLMAMEDLEQLKVLEHGYKIKVVCVADAAFGVDVPEDVPVIEAHMRERGIV